MPPIINRFQLTSDQTQIYRILLDIETDDIRTKSCFGELICNLCGPLENACKTCIYNENTEVPPP